MKRMFIIEAPDGVGKDTAVHTLQEQWAALMPPELLVKFSREPGGTVLGEKVRSLLAANDNIQIGAELTLFWTGRMQLWEEVIIPFLRDNENAVVVLNRSFVSTVAYQLFGRDARKALVDACHYLIRMLLDMVHQAAPTTQIHHVYLDLPVEESLRRLRVRADSGVVGSAPASGDEIQQFGLVAFQQRVRLGYDGYYNSLRPVGEPPLHAVVETIDVIDARPSKEIVFASLTAVFKTRLGL